MKNGFLENGVGNTETILPLFVCNCTVRAITCTTGTTSIVWSLDYRTISEPGKCLEI